MYGKPAYILLLMMACLVPVARAQQILTNPDDVEDLLYTDEDAPVPEPPAGHYSEADFRPLDLNMATAGELEASGLFTAYQLEMLLQYRERYGTIFSIYELSALPGFHAGSPLELEPYVHLSMSQPAERKKPGKHMLLLNLERSFQDAAADTLYPGSPWKTSIRIRTLPRERLSMALCYEKDAGEEVLFRNRPQFFSAYFSYEGIRLVKQLVVGNFKLNQGLGLVNGAGFIHRPGKFPVNRLTIGRIKPHASLTESMYEQGIACRMGSEKFQILFWGSFLSISLSPSKLAEDPYPQNWMDHQWTSGLFRTRTELEGRDLAFRLHYGLQLLYRRKGLSVGVLSGSQWLGPSKQGVELLGHDPGLSCIQKYSIHGNWNRGSIQVFGELASSDFLSRAFLLGTRYRFNDFIQGSLLVHHYGAGYRGSYPSSYGSGNKISNERGVACHLHVETGKNIIAELTGEVFHYPAPRYLTRVPSRGYKLDASLQNPPHDMFQWRARFVSKTWQSSPSGLSSGIPVLQDSRTNRYDVQLTCKPLDWFRWQSRLVVTCPAKEQGSPPAYAAVQQLTLGSSRLKVCTQFVLYRVLDWEARIYLYEPGFYYGFNFPVYYGSGQKTTLLLSFKAAKGIALSALVSGKTNGESRKWECGIQLRLNV